jgi:flagellar biosynthesis protein FlhB
MIVLLVCDSYSIWLADNMSDDDSSDKPHEPTGKKLADAKKKGQFAKTKEFSQALVIFLGMGSILVFSDILGIRIKDFAVQLFLTTSEVAIDPRTTITKVFADSVVFLWSILALPLVLLWISVVFLDFAQNRFIIPEDSLKLDIEKLDPIKGFKDKFLSLQPFVEFGKSLIKLFLLGYIVYQIIRSEWDGLPGLINSPASTILVKLKEVVWEIFWSCMPIIMMIIVLDFGYQWYDNRKKLKMSHEEIKDERKQQEGSPEMKGYLKKKRGEILVSAIMKNIEKADVVVVNPTHFAVGLRYRKEEADAPIVVAKGVDFMAYRIRIIADQKSIPIIENPPLARGLYYQSTEGQEIPPDFYAAVAEVLAIIYQRRQKRGTISPV